VKCFIRSVKLVFCNIVLICSHSSLIFVCFCVECILKLKQCEPDLINVLLWIYNSMWLRICCVLISVSITNWFIRALNQFISLQYSISLIPRFIKVFQISKIIFKGLNWLKFFEVQFTPLLELSLKRFQSRKSIFNKMIGFQPDICVFQNCQKSF